MSVAQPTVGPAASYAPPTELGGLRTRALLVGVAGAVVAGIGAFMNPAHFLRAYLIAFVFWVGVALGCFGLAMLHQLSGGGWGLMIRRVLGAATRTLPFLAIAFVPVVLAARTIYPWADPAAVAADHLLQHKAPYLNVTAFAIRGAIYFAIWIGFAVALNRWSLQSDASRDYRPMRKMQVASGIGIVLYVLTVTFAAIDWLMSVEPRWASSIYGAYLVAGQAVTSLSFVILVALWLSRRAPLAGLLGRRHFHDYGKLLLAFVMVWAYFVVSQFLIIWSGNLPEETFWYAKRFHGTWGGLALLLVFLHFAMPFALLLSRDLKRNAARLAIVATLLLVARWLDLVWQVWPSVEGEVLPWLWIDLAALVGFGGIWVFLFVMQLQGRPLLPVNDPGLPEALGEG